MSPRRQILVAAVAGVVVTMLFFFFVLSPKLNDISKTRAEIEAAQDQEQTLRTDIARLQAARQNAPETTKKLATLARYLPSTPDLPGFIRLVQAAANESVIDLRSIAPSPPERLEGSSGINQISVNLTVRGGFHRVEDFMSRLERLARVVEVRSMSLSPTTDELSDATILEGTITLRMYVVQDNARFSRVRPGATSPTASPTAEAG